VSSNKLCFFRIKASPSLYTKITNPSTAGDSLIFNLKGKQKMKKINWWAVATVGLLAVVILFGAGMFGGWGYRGWGMMGPGMMGNWGYSPVGWFGMGLGMLFMWLIPIGIIALIVFGVASLMRNTGNTSQTSSLTPCSNCGKGIQADWRNCPYCGTALK
jgi:hypothetical protein